MKEQISKATKAKSYVQSDFKGDKSKELRSVWKVDLFKVLTPHILHQTQCLCQLWKACVHSCVILSSNEPVHILAMGQPNRTPSESQSKLKSCAACCPTGFSWWRSTRIDQHGCTYPKMVPLVLTHHEPKGDPRNGTVFSRVPF